MQQGSTNLCCSPTRSRYSRDALPSQMCTPFSCSCRASVDPLMNHSNSSTIPVEPKHASDIHTVSVPLHINSVRHQAVGMAAYNQESAPRQKVRLVVSRGKECRRLKRIWVPNLDSVPVPVRSPFRLPVLMTSSTMSRYCVHHGATPCCCMPQVRKQSLVFCSASHVLHAYRRHHCDCCAPAAPRACWPGRAAAAGLRRRRAPPACSTGTSTGRPCAAAGQTRTTGGTACCRAAGKMCRTGTRPRSG